MSFLNQVISFGGSLLGGLNSNANAGFQAGQNFLAQERPQWEDPFADFKFDPEVYKTLDDGAKSNYQTMTSLGPLMKASSYISRQNKADAEDLLRQKFAMEQAAFPQSVAAKKDIVTTQGMMEIMNTALARPSLVTPWGQRRDQPIVDNIRGPMA